MIKISMVTWNRRPILERVLQAIFDTCPEEYELYVTSNACTDGTNELLKDLEAQGKLRAWYLPENLGTDIGRNASHWPECVGFDTVRMDDKVLPLASGWLTALKVASDRFHAIVGPPYDPSVRQLEVFAPPVECVDWPQDQGRGGPLLFIPGQVTAALGACDELDPEHKYGWTDCLYIERAILLGWHFNFTLHVPVEFLAQADSARRNSAMQWHPLYLERRRQYQEAERDVWIDPESTIGWRAKHGLS